MRWQKFMCFFPIGKPERKTQKWKNEKKKKRKRENENKKERKINIRF